MNLEQAIHQRWANDSTLNALLPVERLKTGHAIGDSMPYATIARETCRTLFRSNAGDALDEVTLRMVVWHDDYDQGRSIVEQIKTLFDRSQFDLTGVDRVIQMRRTNDAASQEDDGTWKMMVEFIAQVYLPSGS